MNGILGIVGDRGSGKTAWMTRYAKQSADNGRRVIANYRLKGFKAELMSFEEFRKIVVSKAMIRSIAESDVFLDELGTGADSYEFFSNDVKTITDFINQIRKLDVNLTYTAQRERQIARRIRVQSERFVMLEDPDRFNLRFPDGRPANRHRDVCRGIFNVAMVNDDMEPQGPMRQFRGYRYYQYYNTDEIIWA